MRKTSTIFSLLITLLISGVSMNATAQRRGHNDDRTDRHVENKNRNNADRWSDYGNHDHISKYGDNRNHRHDHDLNRHNYREVKHVYHDRGRRPVLVYHHIQKPRYIYFRDYDVYYDCHRSVYISYSGRSWTISAGLPRPMHNVNVRTARSYEVDYYNDDFPSYLERRRPSWGREYRGW